MLKKRFMKKVSKGFVSLLLVLSVMLSLTVPFEVIAEDTAGATDENIYALLYILDENAAPSSWESSKGCEYQGHKVRQNLELVFQNNPNKIPGRTLVSTYSGFSGIDRYVRPLNYSPNESQPTAISVASTTLSEAPWYKHDSSKYQLADSTYDFQARYITKVSFKDKIAPTNISRWFYNFQFVNEFEGLENLDTRNCVDMSYAFYLNLNAASRLTSLDLSCLKTDNVEEIDYFIRSNNSLTDVNVSGFQLDKVVYLQRFITESASLKNINLTGVDISKIKSISYFLLNCTGLETLDASSINPASAFDFLYAFQGDTSLKSITFGEFTPGKFSQVKQLVRLNSMFRDCQSLTSIDFGSFEMPAERTYYNNGSLYTGVARYEYASFFMNCKSLTTILNFDKLFLPNLSSGAWIEKSMFEGCESLESVDFGFMTGYIGGMSIFKGCTNLRSINLGQMGTAFASNNYNHNYGFQSFENNTSANTIKRGNIYEGCGEISEFVLSQYYPPQQYLDYYPKKNGSKDYELITPLNPDMLEGEDRLWIKTKDLEDLGYNTCTVSNLVEIGKELPASELFGDFQPEYAGKWVTVSKVALNANGGTPIQQSFSGAVDLVPTSYDPANIQIPTRAGYDFEGWYAKDEDGKLTIPLDPNDTIKAWTYYAKWREHEYNIVLHKNVVPLEEETADDRVTISNVKYSEFVTLPDDVFTKDGDSVIASWNKRPNGTGTPVYAANDAVDKLTIEDGATIDLFAQWHTPEAVVNFDSDGGTPVTRREYSLTDNDTYGGKEKLSDSYLDSRHSFAGWYSPRYERIITDADTVIGSETLVAQWVQKPVITFALNGGKIEEDDDGTYTKVCDYNHPIGSVPIPVKENSTFMGWFAEGGTDPIDTYEVTATADATYTAHWGYQPKFNTNGGSFVADASGEYQTYDILTEAQLTDNKYPLGTLPKVKRDNYTFLGWYIGDTDTMISDNHSLDIMNGDTLNAKWQAKEVYTVNLKMKPDDPEPFESFEVYAGNQISQLTVPVPAEGSDLFGKKFAGWLSAKNSQAYTDASTVNDADTETVTDGGETKKVLTLVAQWASDYHHVTFHANGGQLVDTNEQTYTISVASGSIIEEIPGAKWTKIETTAQGSSEVIEKAFVGWNTEADGKGSWLDTNQQISADVEYYAIWKENDTYTDIDTFNYHTRIQWNTLSDDKKRITNLGSSEDGSGEVNTLVFYPKTSGNVTAGLNLIFELPANADIQKGDIRITIPKNLFKDWDGNPTGSDDLNRATTDDPNNTNVDFLRVTDGDNYIITNQRKPSMTVSEFLISYTVAPKNVKGGFINSNGEYENYYNSSFDVKIEVKNNNDEYVTLQKKTLKVEFHNPVTPVVSKRRSSVSNSWNTEWGKMPPDAEDYFYIKWNLNVNVGECNQPYYLTWTEDTVHDGEVVYSYAPGLGIESDKKTGGITEFYVVTKHRRDDASLGGSWLTLKNQAILSLRLASDTSGSAPQKYRVNGETTAFVERYDGSGNVFKKRIYDDADLQSDDVDNHYKLGGQDLVLSGEANRVTPLDYYISYTNRDNTDSPEHIANGGYKTPPRKYIITDGARGSEDLKIYSGNTKNAGSVSDEMVLADSDYCFKTLTISITEYDSQYLGDQWAAPYVITNTPDYGNISVYVRKANKSDFELYDTLYNSKGGEVTLPENTAGFKVEYTSDKFTTDLKVYAPVYLKASGRLRSIVANHASAGRNTHITNDSHITIEKTVNNELVSTTTSSYESFPSDWYTTYVLTISKSKLFASKTHLDLEKNKNDVNYTNTDLGNSIVTFSQAVEGWAYSENETGTIKRITSGVFYDLLPKGYSVDKNTVYVITRDITRESPWNGVTVNSTSASIKSNNYNPDKPSYIINNSISSDYYSVSFVDNWHGSGQTMMIVNVKSPEEIKAAGFCVYYLVQTTINNLHIHGVASTNYVSFTDTTPEQSLPSERTLEYKTLDRKIRDLYAEVENNQTAYALATTTLEKPTLYQYGADSTVTTEGSDIARHQVVGLNTDYNYHVYYEGSSSSKTANLIIYDVLERQIGGNTSEWRGAFKSIDVSNIAAKASATGNGNCAPRVYYSVKPREDFTRDYFDIANHPELLGKDEAAGTVWMEEPPEDPSRVTAVAVDCRYTDSTGDNKDFILPIRDGVDFTINMFSPDDPALKDKYTYNEADIAGFNMDIGSYIKSSARTSVVLKYSPPRFEKNAFPISGTQENPEGVVINSVLDYVLKITNPDPDVAMNNIVVEDEFPDTLKLNNTITVKFGKGAEIAIDDSAHVIGSITSKKEDSQNPDKITSRLFSATIDILNPGETVEIKIPVQVTAAKGTVLTNQARIVSLNGKVFTPEELIPSPATYHIVTGYQAKVLKVKPNGEPLSGAKLQIYKCTAENCDSNGNLKEGATPIPLNYNDPEHDGETVTLDTNYFVSKDTVWSFNLDSVGDYILHELESDVPAGYTHAEDIRFTIDNEGIINVDGKPVSYVVMVDEAPFKVVYHVNHPSVTGDEDIFKVVESNALADGKVASFDDFPLLENNRFTSFTGWYHNENFTESDNHTIRADFSENYNDSQKVYHLYAHWDDYKVIFHTNPPIAEEDRSFREYENKGNSVIPVDGKFYLDKSFKIEHFYDIPDYGDEYVFAGWYHNADYTDNAEAIDSPADFDLDQYVKRDGLEDPDYHLFAKWIAVGSVAKDSNDANIFNGSYRGFGLKGVQIRKGELTDNDNMEDINFGEKKPGGLRFVTSLSENLINEIKSIDKIASASSEATSFGVEYGYVVGTEANINVFLNHYGITDKSQYKLQYKGENVNGMDTTGGDQKAMTDFRYITNVNCTSKQGATASTGVVTYDHRNYTNYRLYTLVVTYEDDDAGKKDQRIAARSYIRYYDGNGKLRVFYNDYGNADYFGGCMCSFNQVSGMAIPQNQEMLDEQQKNP